MLSEIGRATEKLFNERKDFIIIGLTGRTGSGCTTVANLLKQDYDSLNPPKPRENDFEDNEQRKYYVIYKYAKTNWSRFISIDLRSIIISFLLEHSFADFISYLEQLNESIYDMDQLRKKLINDIQVEFEKLHASRLKIKKEVEEDNSILDRDDIFNFYFFELPNFSGKLQKCLNNHQANLYTLLFQKLGNNIRISGDSYDNNFNPDNIFRLSQRTNKLIKILRKRNLKKKGRVLVVIDALRNPYEATFFKDRYSAFYLFSVNTSDENRKNRLLKKGLTIDQIKALDDQEYPENQLGIDKFASQNIQKCIELADVHLYNASNEENVLKKQLIRYISLIMRPGLVYPTHIERCMNVAVAAKLNSGCLSRQVGASITDSSYSIKAVGWNSSPENQTPCNLRDCNLLLAKDDKEAFSDFEIANEEYRQFLLTTIKDRISEERLNGRVFHYCFKDTYNQFTHKKNQVHTRSLHAEENAFLQIVKHGGQGIKGGYLFTTASPCELCAKKAYQLGIEKIYYIDPYPGISDSHVLQCGKDRPILELFQGAIGEAYNALYTPIIPIKDELCMITDLKYQSLAKAD